MIIYSKGLIMIQNHGTDAQMDRRYVDNINSMDTGSQRLDVRIVAFTKVVLNSRLYCT